MQPDSANCTKTTRVGRRTKYKLSFSINSSDFLGSWGLDGIYPLVVASQSNGGVYIHGRVDDDVARVKRPQILISTPPQALSFPKPYPIQYSGETLPRGSLHVSEFFVDNSTSSITHNMSTNS
ncbi:hypothetical protein AG1IA_01856 [Rhizoctonia solani AG-1 IA]|uniref:Uncharacterized protein n=1 Tax=Thanatephorus cucumeris (strain AG1-IA) TaxID=983506 RepID=L8X1A5_THACA|nr:hypothetical protein AG1IA_01856 [Rhizoctonia solani AG-1 IA]